MLRLQAKQSERVANFVIVGCEGLECGCLAAQDGGGRLFRTRFAIATGDADEDGVLLACRAHAGSGMQGLNSVRDDDLQKIGWNFAGWLSAEYGTCTCPGHRGNELMPINMSTFYSDEESSSFDQAAIVMGLTEDHRRIR